MKYFSPLSIKDVLCLLGVFIVGFGWLLIDQIFIAGVLQRFIALIIILLGLFYFQFLIGKPEKIFYYVNSITLVSLLFIVLISLIVHVLLNNDFNYKSILIWLITACIPYISGTIYSIIKKKV